MQQQESSYGHYEGELNPNSYRTWEANHPTSSFEMPAQKLHVENDDDLLAERLSRRLKQELKEEMNKQQAHSSQPVNHNLLTSRQRIWMAMFSIIATVALGMLMAVLLAFENTSTFLVLAQLAIIAMVLTTLILINGFFNRWGWW